MKITKLIHSAYAEWEQAVKDGFEYRQPFGKYQYIYESVKGMITLVEFLDFNFDGDDFWQIYCLKGNLFDSYEMFKTKPEAEARIELLLN